MKPSIGRIVHFVQRGGNEKVPMVHLPAIIVAVWTDTCVNLQVFTDGTNSEAGFSSNPPSVKWITSATLDETGERPYSWHWPEREES